MSGWVRFENTMPENLKTAPVSDRAFRLWVHAVCYCSRAETDGLVPAAVACSLSLSASKRTVAELVDAGLFEPVENGYLVHDYLEHNPSRARIVELKQAAKKRTARWRDGAGDEPVTRHTDGTVTRHDGVTPHAQAPGAHAPDLPSPTLTEEQEAFDYWQQRCSKPRAKFTDERRTKVRARLAQKYSLEDIKLGIDGAALNPPRDRDSGVVHDDLVSVCRNGGQLERYMGRASAAPLRVVNGGKQNASEMGRDLGVWDDPPASVDVIDAEVVEEEEAS